MGMGITELESLCAIYQKMLRLQDWQIKVSFVRESEMPEPKLQGYSNHHAESQNAEIMVLSEEDFRPKDHFNSYDAEQVLCHELLHIRFYSVDKEDDKAFEFAIDSTADALVALRRK
jgi:hypothetical protein